MDLVGITRAITRHRETHPLTDEEVLLLYRYYEDLSKRLVPLGPMAELLLKEAVNQAIMFKRYASNRGLLLFKGPTLEVRVQYVGAGTLFEVRPYESWDDGPFTLNKEKIFAYSDEPGLLRFLETLT